MSIVVRFTPTPDITTDMYDEVIRRLEQSGDWPPDGRDYHVAFSSSEGLRVSEIWDSPEQLQAFGERLMPLLAEIGVELAGEPEILEVHNIVKR